MGLFNKKKYADSIWLGKIETMDEEYPQAEAIAVKDGKIIGVGIFEAMGELVGPNTVVNDYSENVISPGFFLVDSDLPDKVMEGAVKIVKAEELYNMVEEDGDEAEEAPETDAEQPEEVQIVDPEILLSNHEKLAAELSKHGYTSVIALEHSPELSDSYRNILADLYADGKLGFRYFGCFGFTKEVKIPMALYFMEMRRTSCSEMSDMVNCNMAKLSDANMSTDFADEFADELDIHRFKVRRSSVEMLPENWEGKTLFAASIAGLRNQLGSIEEGKLADFAIWNEDTCIRTVVNGK